MQVHRGYQKKKLPRRAKKSLDRSLGARGSSRLSKSPSPEEAPLGIESGHHAPLWTARGFFFCIFFSSVTGDLPRGCLFENRDSGAIDFTRGNNFYLCRSL